MIDQDRIRRAAEAAQRLIRDRSWSKTERYQLNDVLTYWFDAVVRAGLGRCGSFVGDEGRTVRVLDLHGHRFYVRRVDPELVSRFDAPVANRGPDEVAWVPRSEMTREEQLRLIEDVTEQLTAA